MLLGNYGTSVARQDVLLHGTTAWFSLLLIGESPLLQQKLVPQRSLESYLDQQRVALPRPNGSHLLSFPSFFWVCCFFKITSSKYSIHQRGIFGAACSAPLQWSVIHVFSFNSGFLVIALTMLIIASSSRVSPSQALT